MANSENLFIAAKNTLYRKFPLTVADIALLIRVSNVSEREAEASIGALPKFDQLQARIFFANRLNLKLPDETVRQAFR